MRLILFNKPFQVLTRFTPDGERPCLADYLNLPGFYPAGRLDFDSEGLLLLTDSGRVQTLISHPRHSIEKVYWAQVEGEPEPAALERLAAGTRLSDGPTAPARVRLIEPEVAPRIPPIRYRARIPTTWLELGIREGRNRQVRRMTAAIGHPTLRLIRVAVGPFALAGLAPGSAREVPSIELGAWLRALDARFDEAVPSAGIRGGRRRPAGPSSRDRRRDRKSR
jgi:23S rRNA pseudouridine2457 synthase